MDKIYSRPRIKIPIVKVRKKKHYIFEKRKKSKMLSIFLILIIALITVELVLKAVSPIFDTLCETKAKSIATIISNKEATNIMKEHSYQEMFTIEKDTSGNITMIKSNINEINQITSDIALKIQEDLDANGRQNISIAMGSFTGLKMLAGRGPSVKVQISPVGTVETDLKSEFIDQGINQTIHRVYLQVNAKVNILTPFQNKEKEIANQVLLVENIIVGKIPQNYYNFEGNKNNQDYALEVVE